MDISEISATASAFGDAALIIPSVVLPVAGVVGFAVLVAGAVYSYLRGH